MNFTLPKIYPITDTRLSGISHAEQVEQLIAGGAKIIQLREKHASPVDFFKAVEDAIFCARKYDVKIIINDRVDIALALKANGVHLGQDDLPPVKAREILGDEAIIGYSTHTIAQAIEAVKLPVDYIAVGPIFPTLSKQDTFPVVGIDELKKVRDAIDSFPLVAIGGINSQNLRTVFAAGADSAAMIRSIVSDAAQISGRLSDFLAFSSP